MAKKIRRTIMIIVLVFLLLYFVIMPIVNWNRTYDVSSVNTPEKAIEYYFDAIRERNPRKALAIYPSLSEYDNKPKMFSYLGVVNCKLYSVKEISNCGALKGGEKEYIVDFKYQCLMDLIKSETSEYEIPSCFHVKQKDDTGNWYITYGHSNA